VRTLTDHIVSGDQAVQLEIAVLDEPGQGGAHHDYRISGSYAKGQKVPIQHHMDDAVIHIDLSGATTITLARIKFQNGPIKENGVNGITLEALLAIGIDRLRSFQNGPFPCQENAIALMHCEEALEWLQKRTLARIKRGVEGTNQK